MSTADPNGEIYGLSGSLFLKDDTGLRVKENNGAQQITIGRWPGTGTFTIYFETIVQAQRFQEAVNQVLAALVEQQKTTDIIEEQAARIAELEQELASRTGVQERSVSGGAS